MRADVFCPNGISESSQPKRDCQRIVIFEQLIICDGGQSSTSNSQCGWNCCLELFETTSSSLPTNVSFSLTFIYIFNKKGIWKGKLYILVYVRVIIKAHRFNPDPPSIPIGTRFSKFSQMNNALHSYPQFSEICPFPNHLNKDKTTLFIYFCPKFWFFKFQCWACNTIN